MIPIKKTSVQVQVIFFGFGEALHKVYIPQCKYVRWWHAPSETSKINKHKDLLPHGVGRSLAEQHFC